MPGNKRLRPPAADCQRARQVGKTYILRKFGEEQFQNVVYINLETNLTIASYFNENIQPERLLRYLEASTGERIIPGETLIIFDEIQSCERALTSLKYFCEETPEFHIAAAGSLLGVAINRQHYSFPVGKVETITLYPLDFEEYLWARGKELLSEEIRAAYDAMEPLPDALHQEAVGAVSGVSDHRRDARLHQCLFEKRQLSGCSAGTK